MLRIPDIKENKDQIIIGLKKKKVADADVRIQKLIELDDKRKSVQAKLDDTLHEANQLAKSIGSLIKEGKKDEADMAKDKASGLRETSKKLQDDLKEIESSLNQSLYTIPNAAHTDVPDGVSSDDNEVVFEHGEIPKLSPDAKPHWDLIEQYDIIDFKLGNKITGAGFPVYKGKGAKLQRALINFFLSEAEKQGYMEVQPPILINEDSGFGTGQLPDKEGMMYEMPLDKLFLIPTAEVPITNIYRDVIIKDDELPIKNVGYTPCFRREAGSWGADVRGLNRLHQFDKVEIVQIRRPEDSYNALEEMCTYVQGLLDKLELPYRVLRLCGGDLGFTSAMTFDMEVYSAAQKKWLEVSSVSNFETYQANRLKLRYKDKNNKPQLLHTLNGSALALPRIVAALLENNQTSDGIRIPKVLHPFTGFEIIN